ncbi:MAG TPA: protein kinase [Longimicrobiales bacterium]|nr:protein kinase [Longimicrobiales bacterium]
MPDAINTLNAALDGRYLVERALGEGGMATVYLARDLKHNRHVALKVLKPELAAVLGAERFLAEIETTANLQHPHILPLFDSGEADGLLFYAMPHVEGESLRSRLDREHQLPVDDAVRIATDVAEALDYAHRQGVIHRDIKPANILLAGGRPLVADFGIALAVAAGGGARLTETGLSLGTPHYMSPEQATGDVRVGAATDVYALGCVLYEMLAAEPPYTGSTPQAVLGRIITGEARSISAERKAVPPNVEAAVAKALEKVPADRFRTAGDFARALRDPGFRWGATSTVDSAETARWRHIAAATAGAAVLLAIAVGLQAFAGAGATGDAAPRYFSLPLPPDRLLSGLTSQPVDISADGSTLAYRVIGPDGSGEIWARRFTEREPHQVTGADASVGSIFVSPDGAWVAFNSSSDATVRRAPTGGGPAETVGPSGLEPDEAGFLGGGWGPGGEIVVATRRGLRLFEAAGVPPTDLTSTDGAQLRHRQPVFLPDGSGVLFTATRLGDSTALAVVNEIMALPFGGEPRVLAQGHSPRVSADRLLIYSRELRGDGALWAARMSRDYDGLRSEPVLVAQGILRRGGFSNRTTLYSLDQNGTLVSLSGEESTRTTRLAWIDRGGNVEPILEVSDAQFPERPAMGPVAARLSPDGSRVAFRAVYGTEPPFRISVYDLRRGVLNTLTVRLNADWPVWTPDGERVLFNRFTGVGGGAHDVYWIRADNAAPAEPFWPENPAGEHAQDFSPDGRHLVYQEREVPEVGPQDLSLFSMETGDRISLLDGPGREIQADVSPDGRWLAYVSDESGSDEVYVTEFPEPRSRTKISTGPARSPVWSPSGEELFYMRADGGAILAVAVTTSPTFSASAPRVLVQGDFHSGFPHGRAFDVAPSGNRFIVSQLVGEPQGAPRIEVVLGWLDEVRRRLGQ